MFFRPYVCLFVLILLISSERPAAALEWKFHKGKHFIVKYPTNISEGWAKEVLRKAESYYTTIAREIGYARYYKFWTWEERVNIVLYPDLETYIEKTGLPAWSRGGATKYHRQLKSRAIVSFIQEEAFLDNVLPHEISHLILADFLGPVNIPLWFNEGVAQLQESDKKDEAVLVMRKAVKLGYFIPFRQLTSKNLPMMQEKVYAVFFYAQSVAVVHFLIEQYGSQRFGELCRQLRNGLTFEDALQKAYTSLLKSVEDLEQKWLYAMEN